MPPAVAPVSKERIAAVAATIARGFQDNEVWAWIVPDARRRARLLPRYYRAVTRRIFIPRGGAWATEDARGGALWAPPGSWPFSGREALSDIVGLFPWAGLGGARRATRIDSVLARHHPTRLHYYLQTLSIDPDCQRRGYGSALLAPMLERCDAEGMPAYLETQRESNIPFYRSFGFAEDEPIGLADSPPLWPMWREPGG